METYDKIKRINDLQQEIRDLDYFTDNISCKLPSQHSGIAVVIEIEKSIRLFGRFFFGCGAHEKSISIPSSVLDDIHTIAVDILREKQKELESLLV